LRIAGAVIACCFGLGLLGAGGAFAETASFTYTGAAQKFKVPAGVTSVTIEAAGAQGGLAGEDALPGGKGARLVAAFPVTGGETLNVLVGGGGGHGDGFCEGGGGGGSFVDTSATTTGLLLAAAGGGGGGAAEAGLAGSATEEAAKGGGAKGGAAGTNGNGGGAGSGENEPGAGGGGLLTPGENSAGATGGKSLAEGGAGGTCDLTSGGGEGAGGFGGGGGAGDFAAGGGGGFNGGGGGGEVAGKGDFAGGGGGSFSASAPSVAESGVREGNGLVTITYTVAGEFKATRNPNPCSLAEPCVTNGKAVGTADPEHPEFGAEFQFGAFNVLCKITHPYAKTAAEGAPTWATSESFTTQVKFGKCLTVAHFSPAFEGGIPTTVNRGKAMEFTYLPNAEGKKEKGQVIISAGSAKIGSGICTFSWGGQTVSSKEGEPVATFETQLEPVKISAKYPTGIRESLVFNNAFRGIQWEYEEGQCVGEKGFEEEATKTEGKSATYFGSFKDGVKGGSLSLP
jgi:hypothetical protein